MLEKTKKWAKSQKFMDIGPQMAKSMVDNQKGVNFQHWTIWGPPLKIKIWKIGLRHVLSWPKLGVEPKFHDIFTMCVSLSVIALQTSSFNIGV